MKRYTLPRWYQDKAVTLGTLMDGGIPLAVTLELPWRDNQDEISCIPAGVYKCVPHTGPKFDNVWRLLDVPGRDDVLIHWGNTVADILGCILVGDGFNQFGARAGITDSKNTIIKLRKLLPSSFELEIKEIFQ